MLTAAVASRDPKTGENLRACLEQTGLVKPVMGCTVSKEGDWKPTSGQPLPEVMFLDLSSDVAPYLAFAAHCRRLHPAGHIIACSPCEPTPDLLLKAMHAGVNEFLLKPIDPRVLHEILTRLVGAKSPLGTTEARKVTLVMGAKGGLGSSTVAVNLAVQLAQLGKGRVILLDLARPVGHVPLLLDLKPRFSISDAMENLERLDTHFLGGLLMHHQSGVEVLAGTSQPDEWERLSVASVRRMLNVAQSTFDFVVIDFGSVFSKEWAPLLESVRSVLVLTEANLPALWSLQHLMAAFVDLGLDRERIQIIINRWRPEDDATLEKMEKIAGVPVFARLVNDFRQVSDSINRGIPLSGKSRNSLLSQFQALARECAGLASQQDSRKVRVAAASSSRLHYQGLGDAAEPVRTARDAHSLGRFRWRSLFAGKVS